VGGTGGGIWLGGAAGGVLPWVAGAGALLSSTYFPPRPAMLSRREGHRWNPLIPPHRWKVVRHLPCLAGEGWECLPRPESYRPAGRRWR